jgi:translation initiation factor 1
MSDGEILYSSDGSGVNLAKKKKKKQSFPDVDPSKAALKLRIEKKGRGGKAVTVVYEIPNNPPYFKKLLKELKTQCGTGGTLKSAQMEIQGDNLDKIRELLVKKGFTVKG